MPSKTRTPRTRKPTRTLRPVDHQAGEQANVVAFRTTAEDKLWETLHAHPNATTAELSAAAKIGKSTAQKILVRWAADGSVARTSGIAAGGRRAPDLWSIADIDPATDSADTATDTETEVPPEPSPVETVPMDPAQEATPAPGEATVTSTEDAIPTTEDTTLPAEPEGGDGEEDTVGSEAVDPAEATVPGAADLFADPEAGSAGASSASTADVGTHGRDGGRVQRLLPGALRGMVEDYLRDHPGEEFGPVTIARSLGGKSSGAVSNALDKLVAAGTAVKTQDAPRRYALAPTEPAH
ncbi:MarR family transcriptional regulator [Amycolatopsis pigmentata]|uniref:MarR family transcriptional regulator n=1 Tax=Amycolatopsis pigmentata TaxID=450801 RepID=A0ABW5FZ97_9PSEU